MGTSKDDYIAMKDVIDAVKSDAILSIGVPHKHYIQQVQKVEGYFNKFRSVLETGGMDFGSVKTAFQLANSCRELYSMMYMSVNDVTTRWNAAVEEAELLMYDIREALSYSFRKNPELLAKLALIRIGSSNVGMIQDLNDLATLGRNNPDLINKTGYAMSNIERAAELSVLMADLYAQVTINRSSDLPQMTLTRDKAFTLLKNSIDELCLQARFIFRSEKEKAELFTIDMPRKKTAKKATETITPTATV